MKHIKSLIYFWAVCDLLFVANALIIGNIINHNIPIFTEVSFIIKVLTDPNYNIPLIFPLGVAGLELSMCFSGYFLLKQKKIAALICYLQFPFRILAAHSSISFLIGRQVESFLRNHIGSFIIFETIKIITIIIWHIQLSKKPNKALNSDRATAGRSQTVL